VLATGPLASDAIAAAIAAFTGKEYPTSSTPSRRIIEADTIDRDRVFGASRYGKGGTTISTAP